MQINEPVENIIFNPIIYGLFRVKPNNYGNSSDIINNCDCSIFDTSIKINDSLYLKSDCKIKFDNDENTFLQNKDLLNIPKISTMETKLYNLTTNFDNFQIQTNNTINTTQSELSNLTTNFNNFKTQTNDSISLLEKNCLKMKKLDNNIVFDKFDYNLYIIEKKITITLPIIYDEIIGYNLIFVNTINDTIQIDTNKKNNIINMNHINDDYLLRNNKSINIIAIDLNSWLIY